MYPTPVSSAASFTILSWEFLFGLIGLVVGIIGTLIGFFAWMSQKKQDKLNNYIYKIAEPNLRKDITEQEIKDKEANVKQISEEIQNLQEKIRTEIPIAAKRAVLKDKLYIQVGLLNQGYLIINQLKAELNNLGESPDIPKELLNEIEAEISPEYLVTKEISDYKTYLLIMTTVYSFLATFLRRYFGDILPILFLLTIIPILYRIVYLSALQKSPKHARKIQKAARFLMSLSGIIITVFGVYLYYLWLTEYYYSNSYFISSFLLIIIGILISLSPVILSFISKHWSIPTREK